MNHPIHWLYQQFIGGLPETALRCYLCGAWSAEERYPLAKGIADTFNSHYLAQCPSSLWLCAACQWYFDGKAGHPDFRKMSLYIGKDGWEDWQRPLMKPLINHWLRYGLPFDMYLACSLSKKKHILLQAPLNAHGTKMLAIQVEEQVAHLDYATWEYMDRRFMALLRLGHNKGEILSGDLYGNTLRKHGQVGQALALSQQLAPYRESADLELVSYVTIIDKEKEDGGTDTGPTGDGDHQDSSHAPQSRVESDQPGIQEPLPHGHLDAGGDERSSVRQDEQHAGEISQPALWQV